MLFNSFGFLGFLFVVVLVFYLLPQRFRWPLLLLASYSFYASWQPRALLLLAAVTLVSYIGALEMRRGRARAKLILAAGVIFDLGTLFVFKYVNFFSEALRSLVAVPQLTLLLPAGLSFYTLSSVSYLIDVYRGRIEPEPHLGRFALYVSFFPKIFAGPIDRARTFLPQLGSRLHLSPDRMAEGSYLFLWGLFKKIVIADRLSVFVDAAYKVPAYAPTVDLVVAVYFYAFQIYCDFSGYTDMARGAARLFGIDLMENFKRPYLARSAGEFWGHRWHLSLCTWFRDYMYIPMGGSRVSWPRYYLNLMAVFVVSGLWHGANWTFVVWGALNGLYRWVEAATARFWGRLGEWLPRMRQSAALAGLRILLTFHLITFAWIFFRAPSISDAWTVITRVSSGLRLLPVMFRSYRYGQEFVLSLILIAFLLLTEVLEERKGIWERIRARPAAVRWAYCYLLIFGLLILGKWGLAQFIYMQF